MTHSTPTTYTDNEKAAIVALFKSCMNNMGGTTLADLDADPFTWVDADDLVGAGWTQKEAEGTFGSLVSKCAVSGDADEGFAIAHEDPTLRAIFVEGGGHA